MSRGCFEQGFTAGRLLQKHGTAPKFPLAGFRWKLLANPVILRAKRYVVVFAGSDIRPVSRLLAPASPHLLSGRKNGQESSVDAS